MSNIQQIPLTSPDGVTLATQGKYCRCNLQVVPKLLPITVRENGVYSIPAGHAGFGTLTVDIAVKGDSSLLVQKNGTYLAPEGTAYSSVEVNVPAQKPELPLTVQSNGTYIPPEGQAYSSVSVHVPVTNVIDTDHYCVKVGESFGIDHGGSSPTVICPACVRYYDDGGAIIFTARETGAGTIYLYRTDELIGQYTVVVTAASVNTGNYAITVGHELSIPFAGTNPTIVCPACVDARIDGNAILLTGTSIGIGTVYLYREDLLIGQYSLRVEQLATGDFTMRVGDQLSISYSGSSPTQITHPSCVSYQDDGGTLLITATGVGSGTVCLYREDVLIGRYQITVTEAASIGAYSVKVGETFDIPYNSTISNLSVSSPSCLTYYIDSGLVSFTAISAGSGTIYLYDSDTLIGQYSVLVTAATLVETYDYEVKVGGTFEIEYDSAIGNLSVSSPSCLEYYIDSGLVSFTAISAGSGTIYLYDSDTLIGKYSVRVTASGDSTVHTHAYTSVVTQPTCIDQGYTTSTCACGVSTVGSYTPALGHNYVNGTCTRCGAPDTTCKHINTSSTTTATCTEAGTTTYTCSDCKATWSQAIAALGHSEGDPQLTNTPTCQVCGHYKVYCTRCNELLDEYDDDGNFAEHDWCDPIVVEPTCTSAGYTRVVCNTCGTLTDAPGDPALGHDYQLVADSSQSTGAAMKCTRCDDSYEANYDCEILGHETDEGVYDIDGEAMYKCKHCGEYYPAD